MRRSARTRPATGVPLLVLDMYEHSHALDYGANHAAYVDAFLDNVAWPEVEGWYQRALAARAQLG